MVRCTKLIFLTSLKLFSCKLSRLAGVSEAGAR